MQGDWWQGILLVILAFGVAGCSLTLPQRHCPIESLLVDETSFPPGARADKVFSPLPRAAKESAGRTIYLPMPLGIANHDVYRYKSAARAAWQFRQEKERTFTPGRWRGPWNVPEALTYRSPIADQYYVACEIRSGVYSMCEMIAQYEEYYVYFKTDVSPGVMTFPRVEHALRAIDERMADCLGRPLPPARASPTP